MAAIAAVVGLCCCSSLSAAGGWFGGFISGTKPHFFKTTEAEISERALPRKKSKNYTEKGLGMLVQIRTSDERR